MGLVGKQDIRMLCEKVRTDRKNLHRRLKQNIYNKAYLEGYEGAIEDILETLEKGDWF